MEKERFWNKNRSRRLEEMEVDDRIKIVYMWIKQNVLSLKEFEYLINSGGLTRPPIEE